MEKIVALCKRRGFVYPGSEIYGGLANSWDFGPLGIELKNKIKQLWWRFFVSSQDDMVGIDGGIILNPKVMAGKPIIKGTRLSVQYILNLLADGYTVDELLKEYKGLTKDDINACLLYASETIENTTYMPLAEAV